MNLFCVIIYNNYEMRTKINQNAAETDRGRSFDCDRVHQTLSLIEKLECV